jgi:hypothetical protein
MHPRYFYLFIWFYLCRCFLDISLPIYIHLPICYILSYVNVFVWSDLDLILPAILSYLFFLSCPNDSVHLIPSNLVHLPYLSYLYIYVAYLINVLCIICLYPSQRPCLSRFFYRFYLSYFWYMYIYIHTRTYTYKIIYTYNIILLDIHILYNLLSSTIESTLL